MEEGSSVVINGRRWIIPYYYTFFANAKERWHGRTILEVLSSEFKVYSPSYYVSY